MAKERYKTELGKALQQQIDRLRDYSLLEVDGNDKFNIFRKIGGTRRKEGLVNNSISAVQDPSANLSLANIGKYNPYGSMFYGGYNNNRAGRIYEYKLMSNYCEISNALEYICDDFINIDNEDRIIKLKYTSPNPNDKTKKNITLDEEFQYFIGLFNLPERGFDYCWKFLVEGELFLELIINNENQDNIKAGVLGSIEVLNELVEPIWKSRASKVLSHFIGYKPVYDPADPNKILDTETIFYTPNQLLYVYSGKWDSDMEYMVPFVERARRRYIQLSFIEDAIVIYRMVRAPERLVFTVPTKNLSPYDTERYLKSLMDQHWKSKTIDVNSGNISQKYSPQAMTDAYYFSKPENGESISVSQLKGGENLGELADLDFFLKALYRDLKVPRSYLSEEKSAPSSPSEILQDELKYSRFIIKIQRVFAEAFKQAFITHLKLKGLWKELELHENHLKLEFNPPGSYTEMRKYQLMQIRNEIFNSVVNNEYISKTFALKEYFGMSDKDLLINNKLLQFDAMRQWEIEQMRQHGPMWKNANVGTGDGQPGDDASFGGQGFGDMGGFGGDDGGFGDLGGDAGGLDDFDMGDTGGSDTMDNSAGDADLQPV